jgi:hypothetical protein
MTLNLDIEKLLSAEVVTNLKNEIDKWFKRIGLWGVIIFLITVVLSLFLVRSWIDSSIEKGIESYKSELARYSQKHLDVWKSQKELIFEFVDFMEAKYFNNPNLSKEKDVVLREFNQYYGKLYLILDKDIIGNINKLIRGATSEIQRYYIYREIRMQLLAFLLDRNPGPADCPYISRPVNKASVLKGMKKPSSFKELKEIYDFVEKGDVPGTYKGLPNFGATEK